MRYFISQHQHKGTEIDYALKKEGWLSKKRRVQIALFDHDLNRSHPDDGRPIVKKYFEEGATIITYPHGTTGAWWTDSDDYRSDKFTFADLVIGEGHKYIQEITQPKQSHYVIGWSYCEIKEFIKKNEIKKILFAPIHGSVKDNKLREEALDANSRVYEALLKLPSKYQITIRHLNPPSSIGLHYTSKAQFIYGKPDGSYQDIDNADLVIAEGTYMYLAVARGKPTIGMIQHMPIRPNNFNENFKLKNWDKYGDYMAYPIDFDDGNLEDLINKASREEQVEWKRLFIGNKMNSKNLSDLLISLHKQRIESYKV